MKQKPEISYDRETRQFIQDGKPISLQQAVARWDAIDSDWTQGAYRMMWTVVINASPDALHEKNEPVME